jgi:glyoxylase-like metal-dependent hydrolase (beta-lactamase superfamily II)
MPPAIYTYTAAANGLFVNSYLVETDDGVLAIDAGLLVSDARAFRARLDALHKPLLAVLVTHGHPDHFNGVVELVRRQGDVPIYATPEGKAVIDEVAEPKRAQWSPTYGDEWPAQTAYPNVVVGDGETLTMGGLRIRAHELGPCESASEAVYIVEGPGGGAPVAFTGDLFYNAHHSTTPTASRERGSTRSTARPGCSPGSTRSTPATDGRPAARRWTPSAATSSCCARPSATWPAASRRCRTPRRST